LVALVIKSRAAVTETRIATYNSAVANIANQRISQGQHLVLVDMFDALDTTTDYTDDLHPNDQGYKKIANTWYTALESANGNGWINTPTTVPSGRPGDACTRMVNWIEQGEIATGAGLGAAMYLATVCREE